MRVAIEVDLPGLEHVLASLLGDRFEPTSVQLTDTHLRVAGRARLSVASKAVTLTARVTASAGELRLHDFRLSGALGLGDWTLKRLRGRIAGIDRRAGPFRIRGGAVGDEIVVRWTAEQ